MKDSVAGRGFTAVAESVDVMSVNLSSADIGVSSEILNFCQARACYQRDSNC